MSSSVASAPRSARMSRRAGGGALAAGIDEAGLGPLLGPLAIGFSVLRLPDAEADPWKLLRPFVGKRNTRKAKLVVADSKKVFSHNRTGLRRLEKTVLGFLSLLRADGKPPRDPAEVLFGGLRPPPPLMDRHPWYHELPALPRALAPESVELCSDLLRKRMRAQELSLVEAGVRIVPSGELNASFAHTANKAQTVWYRCLEILRHLWSSYGAEELDVTVDILGGRSHYAVPLRRGFPEATVRVLEESPKRALYLMEEKDAVWLPRRMRISFLAKGEDSSFAVALASCIAKYGRELVMSGFNAFFEEHQPDLRPTAGYRTDAHRWLAEAEGAIRTAGVSRDVLVRQR